MKKIILLISLLCVYSSYTFYDVSSIWDAKDDICILFVNKEIISENDSNGPCLELNEILREMEEISDQKEIALGVADYVLKQINKFKDGASTQYEEALKRLSIIQEKYTQDMTNLNKRLTVFLNRFRDTCRKIAVSRNAVAVVDEVHFVYMNVLMHDITHAVINDLNRDYVKRMELKPDEIPGS